jgi:hypothetical protein
LVRDGILIQSEIRDGHGNCHYIYHIPCSQPSKVWLEEAGSLVAEIGAEMNLQQFRP